MPADIDDRTFARSSALAALNNLRSGGFAPPRATIHSTLLPRGGVDGTVPQWVYVTAAELWVPTEELANAYRRMQRNLMSEPDRDDLGLTYFVSSSVAHVCRRSWKRVVSGSFVRLSSGLRARRHSASLPSGELSVPARRTGRGRPAKSRGPSDLVSVTDRHCGRSLLGSRVSGACPPGRRYEAPGSSWRRSWCPR